MNQAHRSVGSGRARALDPPDAAGRALWLTACSEFEERSKGQLASSERSKRHGTDPRLRLQTGSAGRTDSGRVALEASIRVDLQHHRIPSSSRFAEGLTRETNRDEASNRSARGLEVRARADRAGAAGSSLPSGASMAGCGSTDTASLLSACASTAIARPGPGAGGANKVGRMRACH